MQQSLTYVTQPRIGPLVVGLGCLNQATDLSAGRGTIGCVTEPRGLAPDDKWLYRKLPPDSY